MATQQQLLDTLRDFSTVATRHRPFDRDGVEAWRFTFNHVEHLLHFHTRPATGAIEFSGLMRLQELQLPAPRAIALLKGFTINGRKGDAVILTKLAHATRLDELNPADLSLDQQQDLQLQLIELLKQCHSNQCCPVPLTLARFVLHQDKLLIVPDTQSPGGLVSSTRLGELNASSYRLTTRRQRREFATLFGDGSSVRFPTQPVLDTGSLVDLDGQLGRIRTQPLQGCWWSRLAHLPPSINDFRQLKALFDPAAGHVIKSDSSGTVRQVTFNGIYLIVKSPTPKAGIVKSVLNRFRPSRVMRVWHKTHRLLDRGFATEIPLLVLEHSPTSPQLIVFEKVPGTVLNQYPLSSLDQPSRELLFHRLGRVIRRIEEQGWSHFDTKTSNWVIAADPKGNPSPVLIDCDGVRYYRWRGFALERLLRSLQEHPEFSDPDRLALQAAARHNRKR
jgi:tRNA A-37 threonylcarbamoyl transferase component Bud32